MEETRLGPRPFALPEYGYAVLRFFHEGVSHLMAAKDQVWGMLFSKESKSRLLDVTRIRTN